MYIKGEEHPAGGIKIHQLRKTHSPPKGNQTQKNTLYWLHKYPKEGSTCNKATVMTDSMAVTKYHKWTVIRSRLWWLSDSLGILLEQQNLIRGESNDSHKQVITAALESNKLNRVTSSVHKDLYQTSKVWLWWADIYTGQYDLFIKDRNKLILHEIQMYGQINICIDGMDELQAGKEQFIETSNNWNERTAWNNTPERQTKIKISW